MTTSTTKTVKLTTTSTMGWATYGHVKARNGRIIYTAQAPFGFADAALRMAREWAERKGYTVA